MVEGTVLVHLNHRGHLGVEGGGGAEESSFLKGGKMNKAKVRALALKYLREREELLPKREELEKIQAEESNLEINLQIAGSNLLVEVGMEGMIPSSEEVCCAFAKIFSEV